MLRRILSACLPLALAGAVEAPKMKTIAYRGGVITFLIPKHWKEEYQPEGGGTFYDDRPDAGTLRLNVISAKAPPGKLPPDGLSHFTAKPAKDGERLSKTWHGDGMKFYRQEATEEGQKIYLYTWEVAHCVPPDELHIAIFTWTILARQAVDAKSKKEIDLIDAEISKAYFHRDL